MAPLGRLCTAHSTVERCAFAGESTAAGEHDGSTELARLLQAPPLEMDTSNARVLTWFAVLVLCFQLTACELAKGIFKAGVWVGVLGVVAVLALVGWGISRVGR
jgi:hypothetical protein